ncbi:MAG: paraquat-inducible protein A [Silicimonas sp.]|nr:paraquat-inducible protein A [Silicimonas sp.]
MTPESDLENLIACPQCDALYRVEPDVGAARLDCDRCHSVLIAPSRRAGIRIILLALASVALVVGAATQPFLSIRRFGLERDATLLDTALAFTGPLFILSLAVLCVVLLLPMVRLLLSLYVLGPLVLARRALPGARTAFRMFEILRPWSMAEIFALGAGVALIKIVDLAHVTLGPAFWMFCGFVVLLMIQNTLMCRWSVWKALDQ